MKRLVPVILALTITLSFSACKDNQPQKADKPEDTIAASATTPTVWTHAPMPEVIAEATLAETEATKTEPPAEAFKDKYNPDIEYLVQQNREDTDTYYAVINGKKHEVFTILDSYSVHFFYDSKNRTLYTVDTTRIQSADNSDKSIYTQSHRLHAHKLKVDALDIISTEIYSNDNIEAVAGFYEKLQGISPYWANPKEKTIDFIACGSFIGENACSLTDEEYETGRLADIYIPEGTTEEEYEAIREKINNVTRSYVLYITPRNIAQLSKLSGAAIDRLYCYLSEDGLDLSPLKNARFDTSLDYYHRGNSEIFVHGTPAKNSFMQMINSMEGCTVKLSEFKNNSGYFTRSMCFYNCAVTIDCDIPSIFGIYFCDVILTENELDWSSYSLDIVNCTFNTPPDFTGTTFIVGATNPYCWFNFDCPGQKATGLDRLANAAATTLNINGDAISGISAFSSRSLIWAGGIWTLKSKPQAM